MLYTAKISALPGLKYMPIGELYTDCAINYDEPAKEIYLDETDAFFIREYFVKEHNILYHDYRIDPATLQEIADDERE